MSFSEQCCRVVVLSVVGHCGVVVNLKHNKKKVA